MGETCTAVFLFAEIMENYTKNEKFLQFKAKNRAFRFFLLRQIPESAGNVLSFGGTRASGICHIFCEKRGKTGGKKHDFIFTEGN